jgi:hypothetical protein
MRIVGKYKEQAIRLDSLHMGKTYGGFLLGPSERHMECWNGGILKDLEAKECARLFGAHRPTFIIGRDGFDLKKRLPQVYVLAWLSCASTVKNADEDGSHLVIIWFQESDEDPLSKFPELVTALDWESNARDFCY